MATNKNSQSSLSTKELLIKTKQDLESKYRQLIQEYGQANTDVDIRKQLQTVKNSSSVWTEELLIEIERDLESKERQLVQEYDKANTDVDIRKELQTARNSSSTTNSKSISDMRVQLNLEEKRKRAKVNCDLMTNTEPMKIPSTISNDQSLLKLIETLDNASSKLPVLTNNPLFSRIHRANVLINSSDDAWIYSLNPLENLVLPKKRKDIQTTCRICNCKVQTNEEPTTDFLLCENHQANLDKFVKTIKLIYANDSSVQPPTDRTQFHLNLYGPVLNRLNLFIQKLKTKAAETEQSDIKNIYEIMIDTNIMFKAAIILYERYLNPFNMEEFFWIILTILAFVADHQAEIIDGLNAAGQISLTMIESFLSIATRLLVLTRTVLQTFFGFFAIQVNMIYRSIIANIIWLRAAETWVPIIASILIGPLAGSVMAASALVGSAIGAGALAGPAIGAGALAGSAIGAKALLGPAIGAGALAGSVIAASVLIGAIVVSVIGGIVYLTYNLHQQQNQPAAINADIDGDDLIVG